MNIFLLGLPVCGKKKIAIEIQRHTNFKIVNIILNVVQEELQEQGQVLLEI